MDDPAFLLLATPAGWRLATIGPSGPAQIDLAIPLDAPPAEVALKTSAALCEKGDRGRGILLAIPSAWCFSASIETADRPRNDRKAMLYRLEEKLPLAAESMVADFILHHDVVALGVCARLDALGPLVDALEARHVAVQSIAPAALLVVQGLPRSAPDGPTVLLLSDDDHLGNEMLDILTFENGLLVNWALLPRRASDVKLHLEMVSISMPRPPQLEACGLDADFINSLGKSPGASSKLRETPPINAALLAAQAILAGRQRPWIEFRRGPLAIRDRLRLHRKPLNAALAAGIVLMLGVSAALLLRAHRYVSLGASATREMNDAFAEQFPGWEVPANVRVIVESEHRKAAAGAALGASPSHPARTALQTFQEVLGQLPAEGRFTLNKMSFDGSSFELEGQVRSYEQLDGISAAARKAGMDVEAPESRKNAAGFWDFTLRGSTPAAGKSSDQVARGAG